MTLRPKDYDSNGDIIPSGWKEEKGDLISREALKEEFFKYKPYAVDFLSLIDSAPIVEEKSYDMGYQDGLEDGLNDIRPQGKWLIEGGTTLHYACSECGCAGDEWDKFCKHCGADMRTKDMRGDKE